MSLYPVQDQLTARAPKANVWSCVADGMPREAGKASGISKKFAHQSGRSFVLLCTRLAVSIRNPEDRA
jgi:hypothetical protein